MKTDNFYKIVIIALLVINACTLGYLFLNHSNQPREGRHGNPIDRLIIERLQLTEAQQDQFDMLKHEHHGQMMDCQQESSQLHSGLFALLKDKNKDTATVDSFMQLILVNSHKKEMATYDHFEKLRAILTPEQQPKFDELVEEISRSIMAPHRPEGRP